MVSVAKVPAMVVTQLSNNIVIPLHSNTTLEHRSESISDLGGLHLMGIRGTGMLQVVGMLLCLPSESKAQSFTIPPLSLGILYKCSVYRDCAVLQCN